jgi:signal transduction histidine kinase
MKILQLLILVCLGTAFPIGMTSLLSITRINDIASELSENETPKITTLYQMEILLEEATKEIFDFSMLEQAAQKQEFQASINEFRINAEGLRRLASTTEGQDDKELRLLLDDNLTKQFSYFKDLGEKLISLQENQSEKILQRRALLVQKLDPIIDIRLQNVLSPSDPQYAQKHQALLEMEINMHELFSASSGYIVKPNSSLKQRINDSIVDFQFWLERFLDLNGYYNSSNNNNTRSTDTTGSISVTATPAANNHGSLSMGKIMTVMEDDTTTTTADSDDTPPTTAITLATGEEQQQQLTSTTDIAAAAALVVVATAPPPPPLQQQQQLQQIQNGGQAVQYAIVLKQDFNTVSKLTQDIIELEDIEQNQLSEFNRAETEIGNLLDNKMESIILLNIQALQGSANDMVTIALVSIVLAIMLAITLGIIISSYIARPIKRLRQAVNEVEAGNLDAQFIDINDGDTRGGRRRIGDGNRASRNNKNRISSFTSEELIDLSYSFNSMTEKLKANDRMQREFLGIASHELRSPIQPILSYADLALKGDVPYEQAIEKIFTHALRLQNLANDILDVARIESGQLNCVMRRISVNRVIKDALDSIRDNLRKSVDLEVQLLENDVEIELDRDRIAQVLTNILGNAAKFTKEGKLKIETLRPSENALIEIRITDTGGGIPEQILPRLFEKFATKDVGASAKHGTGLGLYISKAIINAHNGKISAFNNPEGGATFVISLPTRQER